MQPLYHLQTFPNPFLCFDNFSHGTWMELQMLKHSKHHSGHLLIFLGGFGQAWIPAPALMDSSVTMCFSFFCKWCGNYREMSVYLTLNSWQERSLYQLDWWMPRWACHILVVFLLVTPFLDILSVFDYWGEGVGSSSPLCTVVLLRKDAGRVSCSVPARSCRLTAVILWLPEKELGPGKGKNIYLFSKG